MFFLGIDCGTQSLKTIVWDAESGRVMDSAQVSYPLIDGLPPGHKEQHPDTWINALEETIGLLRKNARARLELVAGIGVSGQQHGFVPLDSSHQVIRPAKLWCDTATEPECKALLREAGGLPSAIEETGNGIPAGFTISKVRWLRDHEPENYRRLAHILLPHDFLNLYLSGELVTESGDASGTGFFKVRQRQWSHKALVWIDPHNDLTAKLPRLIPSHEPAGTLRPQLAKRWGIPQQARVGAGGGDNMMGAIGTGNVSDGIITASLGTSGTLYASVSKPVIDSQGEIAAFCDSTGRWLPLACTMNVTVATEMVRTGFFSGAGFDEFDAEVSRISPGSEGLVLLPYLEGERMPNVPQGTGVLLGWRPASASPAHLARAAMEGVTFGLRYGLDRMKLLGISSSEIRLTGGGAKSRVWRQMVADIFDTPVGCLADDEGAAFGAALQAYWMLLRQQGDSLDMGEITRKYVALNRDTCAIPDRSRKDRYAELYSLYIKLSGLFCSERGTDSVFARHRHFVEKYS